MRKWGGMGRPQTWASETRSDQGLRGCRGRGHLRSVCVGGGGGLQDRDWGGDCRPPTPVTWGDGSTLWFEGTLLPVQLRACSWLRAQGSDLKRFRSPYALLGIDRPLTGSGQARPAVPICLVFRATGSIQNPAPARTAEMLFPQKGGHLKPHLPGFLSQRAPT